MIYDARRARQLPTDLWVHPDCVQHIQREKDSSNAIPNSQPFPMFIGDDGWPIPTELLDAAGNVIEYVLWCNTETGMVGRYDVTNGVWKLDSNGRAVVIVEKHPAPLERLPVAEECLT